MISGAGNVVRRESDQREDERRRVAVHPDESNRLKYSHLTQNARFVIGNHLDCFVKSNN